MYKVLWICRFNDALSREQAQSHWREIHAPLVLRVPGVVGYTQNHCVETVGMALPNGEQLVIDGIAEAWWADEQSYLAAMVSPEWKALNEDGAINFDASTMVGATVDEYVVRQAPTV